jgi:uncharacterized protein (DUF58 family)
VRWLDPADQARLRGLVLSPRRLAAPLAAGRHRTMARGFSREFSQHRPYAPGDEVRSIDWKAYARLDRWYVRENRSEERVRLSILLDATGSMSFSGGGRPAKFDAARRAAAALAWIALHQGDEAGLLVVGGVGSDVTARAGAAHLAALDSALDASSTAPETDVASALEAAADRLAPRSAVVVVSDLLGDTTRVLKALRRLASGRRELRVLRVLDADERDFPYEGALLIEGLEGGTLALDAGAVAADYREAFARQEEAYRTALRHAGVPYASTDGGWLAAVARLLAP